MENTITMKRNGTTFIVVLKSAETAKQTFEDAMRKMIEHSAMALKTHEVAEDLVPDEVDEDGN